MGPYLIALGVSLVFAAATDCLRVILRDDFSVDIPKLVQDWLVRVARCSVIQSTWARKYGILLFQVLAALPLILLAAVRTGIGSDIVVTYGWDYRYLLQGGTSTHSDTAFEWLMKFFTGIRADYQWFIAATSILMAGLVFLAIGLSKESYFLCTLLYFITYHYIRAFCFVSQYIAVGFALVGVVLIIRNKRWLGLLLVLIAVPFHSTAAVFVVPAVISAFASRRVLFWCSMGLPLATLALRPLIDWAIRSVALKTRFAYYLGSRYDVHDVNRVLIIINIAVLITMFTLIIVQRSKIEYAHCILFFMQSVATAFCFAQGLFPLTYRFIWYFMAPQIISIPMFLRLIEREKWRYAAIIGVVICETLWLIHWPLLADGADGSLVYRSFLMGA